jgi:hypothetical protein
MPAHSFADTSDKAGTSNQSQMGGRNCETAKQGTSEEKATKPG